MGHGQGESCCHRQLFAVHQSPLHPLPLSDFKFQLRVQRLCHFSKFKLVHPRQQQLLIHCDCLLLES